MQTLWQDLRYGARMLLKKPGFTLIAVLVLVFGISAIASLGSDLAVIDRPLAQSQDKSSSASQQLVDYSSIIAKLKEQILPLLKQNNVPGLAIALVDGEKLIWAEGFSYTDLSNTERVSADTVFSLQSISKTYTATGFMLAVDKGWLKLDEPLRKYLPKFTVKSRFGTGEADRITFRHLLSHWSGLTHEAPCGNNFDESPCPFADHIRSISETWLMFPVGERYSEVISKVEKRVNSLANSEILRDKIFSWCKEFTKSSPLTGHDSSRMSSRMLKQDLNSLSILHFI